MHFPSRSIPLYSKHSDAVVSPPVSALPPFPVGCSSVSVFASFFDLTPNSWLPPIKDSLEGLQELGVPMRATER